MPARILASLFSIDNRVEIVSSPNSMPEGAFYRVRIKNELAKRLSIKSWATLVFAHPYFSHGIDIPSDAPRYLAIHCRVLRFDTVPDNVSNRIGFEDADNVICVDQTLRNALGLPFGIFPKLHDLEIYLLPAKRPLWHQLKDVFAAGFGVRYLVARPKKPDVPDIEKGFARLPVDTLKTLGVEQGDNILIERPFPRKDSTGTIRSFFIDHVSVSLFEAPNAMIENRAKLQSKDPHRYIDTAKALYDYRTFTEAQLLSETDASNSTLSDEPDVPPIFIDAGIREAISSRSRIREPATVFSPVIVRRSIASAVARESLQSGATFGVAFFNLFFTLSKDEQIWTWTTLGVSIAFSLLITTALLIFKLRRQI